MGCHGDLTTEEFGHKDMVVLGDKMRPAACAWFDSQNGGFIPKTAGLHRQQWDFINEHEDPIPKIWGIGVTHLHLSMKKWGRTSGAIESGSGSVGSSRSPNYQMDQSPKEPWICLKRHSKGVTWTVHPSLLFSECQRDSLSIIYESFPLFDQNPSKFFGMQWPLPLCLCRAQVQTAPMPLGVPWLSCSAPWPPCVVESAALPVGWTASVVSAAPVVRLRASGETSSPCESSSPLAHLRCSEWCSAVETRDQWWAVQIATFGIQIGCLFITTLSRYFAAIPVLAANPAQFQFSWI